jgi:sugar phosphate isomerase/epimerase
MTTLSRREFLGTTALALAAGTTASRAADPLPQAKFQLGLVTYNVAANWDLATLLKICKRVGIAAVECRTTHKHGVEPSLSAEQRKEIKKQFADAGVVFWGSGSVCEFHSEQPAVVKKNIEDCKRFVDLVHDLGGKGVKVRPNGMVTGKTEKESCEQIGIALKECGKAAADAGVEIWVEVHGKTSALPKHMHQMMTVCDHPAVGVTWNSNATDLINGSIEEGFGLLSKYIKSCHITDLTQDQAKKYPYRDLFSRFRKMGYDRYTLCEYGKSFTPEAGEQFLIEYKKLWQELVGA